MERTTKLIILTLISFILIILLALTFSYAIYQDQQQDFSERLDRLKIDTITKTIIIEQKADTEIQKVMINNPDISKDLNATRKEISNGMKDLREDFDDDVDKLKKDIKKLKNRIIALETGGVY